MLPVRLKNRVHKEEGVSRAFVHADSGTVCGRAGNSRAYGDFVCGIWICPTYYKIPMRDFEKQGSEMTPSMSLIPGAELYTDPGGLLKSWL